MRSDLRAACGDCGLRLPESLERCPRCNATLTPVAEVRVTHGWRAPFAGVRPVRDLLLYVPALLGCGAAAIGAVMLAADAFTAIPDASLGLVVALAIVSLLAGFAAFSILFGVAWLVWAAPVFAVAWLLRSRGKVPGLEPAPFPALLTRAPPDPLARWSEAWAFVRARKVRIVGGAFLAILLVELGLELLDPRSTLFDDGSVHVIAVLGAALLAQALGMLAVSGGTALALAGLGRSVRQLVLVRGLLAASRARRRGSDYARARPALVARASARGVASALEGELVAPLSGRACLAFRLQGRLGAVALDDGAAASMLLRARDEELTVPVASVAVALDEPVPAVRTLDEAQRARLEAFLRERAPGAVLDDVELFERSVVSGDEVIVHGAEGREIEAGGYRSTETRRVLGDSDGSPVLIERAGQPSSSEARRR